MLCVVGPFNPESPIFSSSSGGLVSAASSYLGINIQDELCADIDLCPDYLVAAISVAILASAAALYQALEFLILSFPPFLF